MLLFCPLTDLGSVLVSLGRLRFHLPVRQARECRCVSGSSWSRILKAALGPAACLYLLRSRLTLEVVAGMVNLVSVSE